MAELRYKTRGNTDPKGKPNVFFCCHPDDFDTYFEPISTEILAKQNCAIWYLDKSETEHDEDFLFVLR